MIQRIILVFVNLCFCTNKYMLVYSRICISYKKFSFWCGSFNGAMRRKIITKINNKFRLQSNSIKPCFWHPHIKNFHVIIWHLFVNTWKGIAECIFQMALRVWWDPYPMLPGHLAIVYCLCYKDSNFLVVVNEQLSSPCCFNHDTALFFSLAKMKSRRLAEHLKPGST